MEVEHIIKRVDWLDDEHRKDKSALVTLDERLKSLEGSITPLAQQPGDLAERLPGWQR
jgi:hypothetical protein